MFRAVLLRSARSATCQAVRRSSPIARPALASSFVKQSQFAPSAFQAVRCYSAAAGLEKPEVEGRIIDLLKNFDKVSFYSGFERTCANLNLRFLILRRYNTNGSYGSCMALTRYSFHTLPTLPMIWVWTVWIRLRL